MKRNQQQAIDAPVDSSAEVDRIPPPPAKRRTAWPFRVIWWMLRRPGWWLLRRLWRHRDLHTPWWIAIGLYITAAIAHATGTNWWITVPAVVVLSAAAAVAARYAAGGERFVADLRDTVTGVVATAGGWMAAATLWGPANKPATIAWAALTASVFAAWWRHPSARTWRTLRARVRSWRASLPVVLAQLGAAGVVIASRPRVQGNGRVEFPLRLPVGVTRADLDKLRAKIEGGMHWPENSIREFTQDPAHSASSRILLIWQEGKIKARVVKFAPPTIPATAYDPVWLGATEDGTDFYLTTLKKGYGATHGLYGGMTGSTKSNLLRLIAWLRAHCPDVLIWVIDLKSGGMAYAPLLPRIDYIATTRDQAIRMFEDGAAIIPARGELLEEEHNQVLPAGPTRPAVLIIGDEVRSALAKKPANATAVEAATKIVSEGRAFNVELEAATQYLSQGSVHPDLLPNFHRSFMGRTRGKADAQFALRGWNRLDSTQLPPGAFFHQVAGSDDTTLLFTPETTDTMLKEVAIKTVSIAPALEESTASRLPHYNDRWAFLDDNLLRNYASEEQRRMVLEARTRLGMTKATDQPATSTAGQYKTARAAAAADRPLRLVVTKSIDIEPSLGEDLTLASIRDPHLRALVEAHLSPGLTSTADSNAAVSPDRSRAWASERRAEWRRRGLVEQPSKGKWRTIVGERDMVFGVLAAEEDIRAGRTGGGEATDTDPSDIPLTCGDTPATLS